MTKFEPHKLLKAEPFKSFLSTWKAAITDADSPPYRKDISLQKFAKFVTNMAIMERADCGSLAFRLMGSEMSERTELALGKHTMTDLLPNDFADDNLRIWSAVMDKRAGAIGQFSVHYPNGNCRDCRSMLLPMRAKDGSSLVIALTQSGSIFAVREAREAMEVGADYAYSQLFDAGLGLPENADYYTVARHPKQD